MGGPSGAEGPITHVAILRCDFGEAAELAAKWAQDEIFNPHAAGIATYLLADYVGDFDRAIKIGRDALQIAGSTDQLINNLAYALALAGRTAEARDLLPEDLDDVYLIATAGLIDILDGEIERGIAGYDRAYELAKRLPSIDDADDSDLPARVVLNKEIALRRAHHVTGITAELELPSDWAEHPYLVLAKEVAERAGIRCVAKR